MSQASGSLAHYNQDIHGGLLLFNTIAVSF